MVSSSVAGVTGNPDLFGRPDLPLPGCKFPNRPLARTSVVTFDSPTASSDLSAQKAELTKMDLVPLNTRVGVIQEMLKDDLALPLVPTSFQYDAESKRIRIAVYVASDYLPKTGASQLTKILETRASSLCAAPETSEGNFVHMFPIQPPKDYCAIRFFARALGHAGAIETKDAAEFVDGKLALK